MDIDCQIKKSRRAKNIRLSVRSDGSALLTIPWWAPKSLALKFLEEKKFWLVEKIKNKQAELKINPKRTRKDYLENKESARKFVWGRLEHFNSFYNFEYKNIAIRDQKTRWGSCSRKKNLNFSYRIIFLPSELADYLIVHELCHLKEMNHSPRFWALVEKTISNYKLLRKSLRKTHV